jgi:hypothetical protein
MPNTVVGSAANQSFGNVKNHEEIKKIIDEYPNVILFNSHSHLGMQEPSTLYKFPGGSRALNTAAVVSLWQLGANGIGGCELPGSQGYYVTVYDDAVLVQGRDFITGEWISNAYYLLPIQNPPEQTQQQTTKAPVTQKPSQTEQEAEDEKDGSWRDLIAPAAIVAALVLIAFIIVFKKTAEPNSQD